MNAAQQRAVTGGLQAHSVGSSYPFHPVGFGLDGLWRVDNLQTGRTLHAYGVPWVGTAQQAIDYAEAALLGRLPDSPASVWSWAMTKSSYERAQEERLRGGEVYRRTSAVVQGGLAQGARRTGHVHRALDEVYGTRTGRMPHEYVREPSPPFVGHVRNHPVILSGYDLRAEAAALNLDEAGPEVG
jgi:hypothetical protein